VSKLPRYIVGWYGVAQLAKTRLGPLSIFSHIQRMLVITNPNSFTSNEAKSLHYILEEIASSPILITQRNSSYFSIS